MASLSISLAALLLRFFVQQPSAKAHLFTAVIVVAVFSVAITATYSVRRAAEVSSLAEKVYLALGNQEKTTDQILIDLGNPDDKAFAAALALLRSQGRVESRPEECPISKNQMVAIRLWRALTADSIK